MAKNSGFLGQTSKDLMLLSSVVDIGASGAPTKEAKEVDGFQSIVRNGTGDYTITTNKFYPIKRLRNFQVTLQAASAEDLTFQVVAVTANTIQFICKAAATETDPSNGSKLYIQALVGTSQV